MGAVVVYGHSFEKDELRRGDRCYIYLRPADGGSFELSYSSLDELKQYCERFDVKEGDWPDYIDLGGYDIPESEVLEKNSYLRQILSGLTQEDYQAIPNLEEIADILRRGQSFYIH